MSLNTPTYIMCVHTHTAGAADVIDGSHLCLWLALEALCLTFALCLPWRVRVFTVWLDTGSQNTSSVTDILSRVQGLHLDKLRWSRNSGVVSLRNDITFQTKPELLPNSSNLYNILAAVKLIHSTFSTK